MASFGDYQIEIYFAGLSGVVPTLPMTFDELERRAERAMSPSVWSYVAGGAGYLIEEGTVPARGFAVRAL